MLVNDLEKSMSNSRGAEDEESLNGEFFY